MEKKPTKCELPPRALLALLLGIFIGAVFSGRYDTLILGAIVAVVGVVVFLRWYKWW